ncbi:MAG: HAD family hydrolase [Acidimicrobiales bacterium]
MPSKKSARAQLVIFDCDGVLVDTERLAVPIDVQILREMGWEISPEEVVERFLGRSEADCNREIEEHLGRPLPPESSFEFDRRYREAFEHGLEPVAGVAPAIDAIICTGLATCVASSGSHEKMRWTLGLTGLWERFEGRIFSVEEVERGKPAPDLFLHAARSMGFQPADCAVVEDSPFGVQAALAAGMAALAYAGGLTPRHRLSIDGAVLFEDMAALPGLLGL